MADAYDSLSASQKEKMLLFFKAVGREAASSSRARRATETCQTNPITATALEDSLFMIQYDNAQEFEACLGDEVLKANLALLMEQPLPNDYLSAVKRKLDKL
ncbi:mesothelin-like protein [Pogona vitticeps]